MSRITSVISVALPVHIHQQPRSDHFRLLEGGLAPLPRPRTLVILITNMLLRNIIIPHRLFARFALAVAGSHHIAHIDIDGIILINGLISVLHFSLFLSPADLITVIVLGIIRVVIIIMIAHSNRMSQQTPQLSLLLPQCLPRIPGTLSCPTNFQVFKFEMKGKT